MNVFDHGTSRFQNTGPGGLVPLSKASEVSGGDGDAFEVSGGEGSVSATR